MKKTTSIKVFSAVLLLLVLGTSSAISAGSNAADTKNNTQIKHKGIPGNRGAEHFGFTVPNLKEAVDFFENIIGAEVVYEIGPFASDDNWMKDYLNVHPRTRIPKVAIVRCGNGSNFEIFEFEAPDQDKTMPKNSDWGGRHIAFYVDDVHEAVKYLKANNIKVLGEPVLMEQGPNAGETWVYFLSPWGMQFELVSYENGMAYEKLTDKRAFSPKK
jgi:catechol 2,3-dioxygenase-like lactoylglutathione lyase family enzyme